MYSKLIIFCVLALFLMQLEAQRSPPNRDRELCKRLNKACEESSTGLPGTDDAIDSLNEQCLIIRGPQWRNVTRCQIVQANCEYTMVKCRISTCKIIEELFQRS